MSDKIEKDSNNINGNITSNEQENNENEEIIEVADTISGDTVSEELENLVEEGMEKSSSDNKVMDFNYLDPSILNVRKITQEEIDSYIEDDGVAEDLSEKYLDTFADIRQQEVVEGTVVNINDRDVLIDIGFKAEGIVSRAEFKELPEIGEKVGNWKDC